MAEDILDEISQYVKDDPFYIIDHESLHLKALPNCDFIEDHNINLVVKKQDLKVGFREYAILRTLSINMKNIDRPFPAPMLYHECESVSRVLASVKISADKHDSIIIMEYIKRTKFDRIKIYMYDEILRLVWSSLRLMFLYGFRHHGNLHFNNVIISKVDKNDTRLNKSSDNQLYHLDNNNIPYKYNLFIINFEYSKINTLKYLHMNIISDILCYSLSITSKMYSIKFKELIILSLYYNGYFKSEDIDNCGESGYLKDHILKLDYIDEHYIYLINSAPQFIRYISNFIVVYGKWLGYISDKESKTNYDYISNVCDFMTIITSYTIGVVSRSSTKDEEMKKIKKYYNPTSMQLSFMLRKYKDRFYTRSLSMVQLNHLSNLIKTLIKF